ncbi:MAG: SipW-dependent-type signal peptide-containing protein, partial [Clostridia bacterium]|nr:SipW-dependent-type signal peptide-containing protein [Clostridia bacterium]
MKEIQNENGKMKSKKFQNGEIQDNELQSEEFQNDEIQGDEFQNEELQSEAIERGTEENCSGISKMQIEKIHNKANGTNDANEASESNVEKIRSRTTTKVVDRKRILLAAIILLIMLVATGIYAYFTSTKTATNVFTMGSIDIVLTEGNVWDTASENGVAPEGAQNIEPGQHITKAPNVQNVGKNPAYVYLKVYVPV